MYIRPNTESDLYYIHTTYNSFSTRLWEASSDRPTVFIEKLSESYNQVSASLFSHLNFNSFTPAVSRSFFFVEMSSACKTQFRMVRIAIVVQRFKTGMASFCFQSFVSQEQLNKKNHEAFSFS